MTISFRPTSTYCRGSRPATRMVPAASVWEPARGPSATLPGARVRTLAPCPVAASAGIAPESSRNPARDRVTTRQENRHSFLLGATLGFALVAGSLHLIMEEGASPQPEYVSTVTAEVAK